METSTDAQHNPTLCRWGKDAKQKSSAEVKAGQGEVARIHLEVSLTSLQVFHGSIQRSTLRAALNRHMTYLTGVQLGLKVLSKADGFVG